MSSLSQQLLLVLLLSIAELACGMKNFAGSVSQGTIKPTEQVLLNYTLSSTDGDVYGVITNWWIGGSTSNDLATLTFHVDNDQFSAPIVMRVALACGVGFQDEAAPWETTYFGHGAATTGWHNFIPIPFGKNIVVTYRADVQTTVWITVKGNERPTVGGSGGLVFGSLTLPPTARLQLQTINSVNYPALAFVDLAVIPETVDGNAFIFMTTLAIESDNENVLEGCFRVFNAADRTSSAGQWPGVLIATGTEDYFLSSYYFDAGTFRGENSGLTHMSGGSYSGERSGRGSIGEKVADLHNDNTDDFVTDTRSDAHASASAGGPPNTSDSSNSGVWRGSMYRIHQRDPLLFGSQGGRLTWRVGDVTDPATGLKCTLESGGSPVGSPGNSTITSYVWIYTW